MSLVLESGGDISPGISRRRQQPWARLDLRTGLASGVVIRMLDLHWRRAFKRLPKDGDCKELTLAREWNATYQRV